MSAVTSSSSEKIESGQQEQSSPTIIDGRSYHNTDSAYWLPNDADENDRLRGQHFALKSLFGGNFNAKVLDYVSMDDKATKVLDCGCGPGAWVTDVAKDYPDCQLTGVDISDVFPTGIQSSNVCFKLGNVLTGLPFDDNMFDFIYIRLLILALRVEEWPIVFKELRRILKPGGVIQSLECYPLGHGREFPMNVSARVMTSMKRRGQDPLVCAEIPSLLHEAGFEIVETVLKGVHLGQNDPTSREFLVGIINTYRSLKPFMAPQLNLKTDEEYDEFLKKLSVEYQKEPQTRWDWTSNLARKPF
ncbi:S-adenosyl-L-methionine-dependent methyltransferase [Chlamydoabsidia padenii]|nr:S-adenosyl-L-methionine-dependent methyltransferase [Chlamydoabsidia padenii]